MTSESDKQSCVLKRLRAAYENEIPVIETKVFLKSHKKREFHEMMISIKKYLTREVR